MRVGSQRLNGSIAVDPAVGLLREYAVAKQERNRNPVLEFQESLMQMPIVLFVEDRGKLSLVCDQTSSVYQRVVEEYADLSRLDARIEATRQMAWTIAMLREAKTTCAIYDRIVRDVQARLWFVTNANPAVVKSFKFWHAGPKREALAKLLTPIIVYKKALAKIEEYERVMKPITEIVNEYRADDLLKW